MEYIKKEDVVRVLEKFIDARKTKNCSKATIIERKAFEYALAIVNQVETHDFEEN
jgi:hypothetical protein